MKIFRNIKPVKIDPKFRKWFLSFEIGHRPECVKSAEAGWNASAENYKNIKDDLVKISATLLMHKEFISPFAEDNPKTTPKTILKQAEVQNEVLRKLAIRLKEVADNL